MPLTTLKPTDYAKWLGTLGSDDWIIVCFCAGWCKSCREYRPGLTELAQSLPDVHFFWVDIEDHGDMLGDMDVEKFPTVLIQRGDTVAFYSCLHPDARQLRRILQSQMEKTPEALAKQADSNEEHRMWQRECNFKTLLQSGLEAVR